MTRKSRLSKSSPGLLLWGVVALGLVGAVALSSGCQWLSSMALNAVELRGASLDLQELGWSEAQFLLEVELENPSPVSVPVNAVDYSLSLGEVELLNRVENPGTRLEPGSPAQFATPVTIRYADVAELIWSLHQGADFIPYTGEIGLSLDQLGSDRRIAIPLEGEIPTPRPPDIAIEDFDYEFNFPAGMSGTLTLNAENEVDRLGQISDLFLNLDVAGHRVAQMNRAMNAENGNVTVPWTMNGFTAVNAARSALDSGGLDAVLQGEIVFDASWGPVRVPIDLSLLGGD